VNPGGGDPGVRANAIKAAGGTILPRLNADGHYSESATPPGVPPGSRDLAPTVYACLRAIAQRQMAGERRRHTLTATALVHEAYLRLAPAGLAGADRARFFAAAAEAMRRILVDHARRRGAAKRGGGALRVVDMESVIDLARDDNSAEILALDDAVSRLEEEDTDAAAVVRLRFYAGLTGDQVSESLGISPRQVDREWAYARAFLLRELRLEGLG
jgi:RNA polymerase sigma factor (TIGR02999 family)